MLLKVKSCVSQASREPNSSEHRFQNTAVRAGLSLPIKDGHDFVNNPKYIFLMVTPAMVGPNGSGYFPSLDVSSEITYPPKNNFVFACQNIQHRYQRSFSVRTRGAIYG